MFLGKKRGIKIPLIYAIKLPVFIRVTYTFTTLLELESTICNNLKLRQKLAQLHSVFSPMTLSVYFFAKPT